MKLTPLREGEIVVIDDLMSPSNVLFLLEAVKSTNFPWFYIRNTHTYEDDPLPDSHGFIHWLLEPPSMGLETSAYLNIFSPILYTAADAVGMQFEQLIRARVNLSIKSPNQIPGYPHVDWTEPRQYWSALYYLEDSDGDTLFYDYKCTAGNTDKNPLSGAITERVSPKRNRAVVFNGHIAHSASLPLEHQTRTVVNFCFLARPLHGSHLRI